MISLSNWMVCWTSILVKISQGVCSTLLSVSKGLTLKFLGFLPKFLVSPFLFYFFYFIFLFWKTLICWRYLALRSIWIEQNSDAVEIVFELALYEVWVVVVVEVSEVNENVADIIGLSAVFGCWVKVLSLFRRRSEFCNNFQFGYLLCVSLCCFTVVSNDLFGVVRNEVAWIHYFYTHLTLHFYTKHMELA